MEHIEEAGIHSGDSACVLPPITLGKDVRDRVVAATRAIAEGVGVRGLINIQFALASDVLYVIEANPRASRTVPFTSKATGVQLAKAAAMIGVGVSIAHLRTRAQDAAGDRRRRQPAGRRAGLGEGSGASLRPLPHPGGQGRRLAARPGNALHRRGHGHRQVLRHRLRQVRRPRPTTRCRPPARSSSRWPTATSARSSSRSSTWPTSASRSSPPAAPPRCCAATASRPPWSARSARALPRASPTSWT